MADSILTGSPTRFCCVHRAVIIGSGAGARPSSHPAALFPCPLLLFCPLISSLPCSPLSQVVLVDIAIADGLISSIHPARSLSLLSPPPGSALAAAQSAFGLAGSPPSSGIGFVSAPAGLARAAAAAGWAGDQSSGADVDLRGSLVWPTLLDMHTHIDKGHTCERSRNHDGSLDGAGVSVERDEVFWSEVELRRRMEFALRTAYAHGTCAIRTHLMSAGRQASLTWPVFAQLRSEWAGRVELQGVALVVLAFFRDEASGRTRGGGGRRGDRES